jgi:hypothetical protein
MIKMKRKQKLVNASPSALFCKRPDSPAGGIKGQIGHDKIFGPHKANPRNFSFRKTEVFFAKPRRGEGKKEVASVVGDVFVRIGVGKRGKEGKSLNIRQGRFPADFFPEFPAETLQSAFAGVNKAAGEVQLAFSGLLAPDEEEYRIAGADDAARGGGGIVVIHKAAGTAEHFALFKPDVRGTAGGTITEHGLLYHILGYIEKMKGFAAIRGLDRKPRFRYSIL